MVRWSILIFLLVPHWASFAQNNDLIIYHTAIDMIKQSDDFIEYTEGKSGKVQVMETMIPFKNLSIFFKDSISDITGLDHFILANNPFIDDERLSQLSDTNRSKLKLFLSTLENDLFIVEIAYASRKRDYSYEGIFMFGPSLSYLFKTNGEKVDLVASMKMWNN